MSERMAPNKQRNSNGYLTKYSYPKYGQTLALPLLCGCLRKVGKELEKLHHKRGYVNSQYINIKLLNFISHKGNIY